MAKGLLDKGYEVSVLTGQPNYPKGNIYEGYSNFHNRTECYEGINIHRAFVIPRGKGSGLRLFLNYISLAFFASLKVLFIKDRFDKIVVFGASPVTIGLPAIVAKYRFSASILFWVQDLWPESIIEAGGIKNRNIIYITGRLTEFIYRNSEKILVQSKAFIPYIVGQQIKRDKISYLPNSTESFYTPVSSQNEYRSLIPQNAPVLMFAGNIGKAQGFNTIIQCASVLEKQGVRVNWIILGDGREREIMEQNISELGLNSRFHFLGSFPSEEMSKFFALADGLLVTLKRSAIFSMTVPSKVQSYMACGKPIIANIDGESSRLILEAKCGVTSPAENHVAFATSIKEFLALDEEEKKQMGRNARLYFVNEFHREKQLRSLVEMLEAD